MTYSAPHERMAGAATGSLGLLVFFALLVSGRAVRETLVDVLLLVVIPGLLVALGSYLHAGRWKRSGAVLLTVSGSYLALMFFVHLFGGAFYLFGLWLGIAILAQSVLAILTMSAAFGPPKKL